MSQDFSLTTEHKNSFLLIKTSGYINVQGGEKIADAAYKHIDKGVKHIVLDLEDSRVVNSIGISILIEIIEKLQGVNGKLHFVNLTPTIDKTFNIMGLYKFADKHDSVDAIKV